MSFREMGKLARTLCVVGICGGLTLSVGAQDAKTDSDADKAVQSPPEWRPIRVCVLDFTTIDIRAKERFLDGDKQSIRIPVQCTLTDADRQSISPVMQGFVRMIDARNSAMTDQANRRTQQNDNRFERSKALELYRATAKSEMRPVVIGAEYLTAGLGNHSDVFACMDSTLMAAAMKKLAQTPDFPQDFLRRLSDETGASHLIYGTVSDPRYKSVSFSGYGVETVSTNYELDVILKVVDLVSQSTVYSKVYTGHYREQKRPAVTQFDSNIFQTLMNAALEQAVSDLYEVSKPGRGNRISVTPPPAPKAAR